RDWSVTGVQTCALPIWLSAVSLGDESIERADGVGFRALAAAGFGAIGPRRNIEMGPVLRCGDETIDEERSRDGAREPIIGGVVRSEERRVGKGWRRWSG